ncbi:MAG TPA: hypothetical protein VFE47_05690 [Tepidisphaeraceae bacterium]|jgi:hypothetical protein|nr:hypothetical protein [Tepidisphaeraceae bacterium]
MQSRTAVPLSILKVTERLDYALMCVVVFSLAGLSLQYARYIYD